MNPLVRMEKILFHLRAHPEGISGSDLAEACGVAWPTIKADLENILLHPGGQVPIYSELDEIQASATETKAQPKEEGGSLDTSIKWYVSDDYQASLPLRLSLPELFQILEILGYIEESIPQKESLRRKLLASFYQDKQTSFRTIKGVLTPLQFIDNRLFPDLQKAIKEKRRIRFAFRDRSYRVKPLHLVYYTKLRSWYLLALDQDQPKLFNMQKISDAEILAETFRSALDTKKWLKIHWGTEYGEMFDVKVRFYNQHQTFSKLKKDVAHRECTVTMEAGGESLLYEDTIVGKNEFLGWLLGFGAQAKVLHPPELREALLEKINATLAQYTP